MITFKVVAERYKRKKTEHDNERSSGAITVIEKLIKEFGHLPITNFDVREPGSTGKFLATSFKEDLVAKGYANGYVNSFMRYLKTILIYARDELDLIVGVPKMKMLKENKREIFLSPEQVMELIQNLEPIRADMVVFAVNTGQRQGNVRNLRWSQIEDDMSAFTLESTETKNGKRIVIPINDDGRVVLKRRLELRRNSKTAKRRFSDYVFSQENGKPYSISTVCNQVWHKAVKKAGLPEGVVFHTLRHTFASWHLLNGTTGPVLQKLGGWKSTASMERYSHLDQQGLAKASSNINGMMTEYSQLEQEELALQEQYKMA